MLKFIRRCWASGNDVVNFIAQNGVAECPPVLTSMFSFAADDLLDVLCPFWFDDMISACRHADDMLLSYADVISDLAIVRDSVLAFTDFHFFHSRCMFFY